MEFYKSKYFINSSASFANGNLIMKAAILRSTAVLASLTRLTTAQDGTPVALGPPNSQTSIDGLSLTSSGTSPSTAASSSQTPTFTTHMPLPIGHSQTSVTSSSLLSTTSSTFGPYSVIVTLNGQPLTAISVPSGIVIGTSTISFGSLATYSGVVVSAGTFGVVVNPTLETVTTGPTSQAIYNTATTTSFTPHVSETAAANSSCAARKIVMSYFKTRPGAIVIVAGKTLMPGGPAITPCGKVVVSEDAEGLLLIDGITQLQVPLGQTEDSMSGDVKQTIIRTYSGSRAPWLPLETDTSNSDGGSVETDAAELSRGQIGMLEVWAAWFVGRLVLLLLL